MIAWSIVLAVAIFTLINFVCVDEASHIFWATVGWAHILSIMTSVILLASGGELYMLLECEIATWVLSVAWFDVVGLFWWINEWSESRDESARPTIGKTRTTDVVADREIVYEGVVVDEYPPLYANNPQTVRLLESSYQPTAEDNEAWERLRRQGVVG